MASNHQHNIRSLPRLPDGNVRFARGWYCIGPSQQFNQTPQALHYFSQEFVAFRDDDQLLHVFDAHCPHLGAHLGYGGRVVDNQLQCPLHGWMFNNEGTCIHPKPSNNAAANHQKQCLKAWTTMERSGIAFIWYDPENNPPYYDIPAMQEYGQTGWSDWDIHRLELKTQPREIIENVADSAHFCVVHHMQEVSYFKNSFDGHLATQMMEGAGPAGGRMKTTATYYGPAFQYTWMRAITDTRLINCHTPVDEQHVHLWFGVMMHIDNFSEAKAVNTQKEFNKLGYGDLPVTRETLKLVQAAIVDVNRKGYYDDVAIWEHKRYRPSPALCDGDGPIHKLRQWYAQFYRDR